MQLRSQQVRIRSRRTIPKPNDLGAGPRRWNCCSAVLRLAVVPLSSYCDVPDTSTKVDVTAVVTSTEHRRCLPISHWSLWFTVPSMQLLWRGYRQSESTICLFGRCSNRNANHIFLQWSRRPAMITTRSFAVLGACWPWLGIFGIEIGAAVKKGRESTAISP